MAEAQQAYLLSSLFRIILRKNKRLFEMIPNKKMIGVSFVSKTPILWRWHRIWNNQNIGRNGCCRKKSISFFTCS